MLALVYILHAHTTTTIVYYIEHLQQYAPPTKEDETIRLQMYTKVGYS